MSVQKKPEGMKIEKLFEQFTKSNTIIQNSFQIVYDGMKQLADENAKLRAENLILKGEAPKIGTSPAVEEKPKNRKERRKEAKKNDKPVK